MAASDFFTTVQAGYIAYYGRPADPIGLNFWADQLDRAGGNVDSIINAFATSDEFALDYAGLTDVEYVNQIYVNILGRNADSAGLTFYTLALANGTLTRQTLPLDVLNGATGTDRDIVNNKIFAANAFTTALDSTDEIVAYNAATKELAVDWLGQVTADPATAVAAVGEIPSVIADMVGTSSGGDTFALTLNEDNLVGTPQGDVFNATAQADSFGTLRDSLQSVDDLNGAEGLDTLDATLVNGATQAPSLTSVENVVVRFADGGGQLDLINATGTTTVRASGSTTGGTFLNTGAASTLAVQQNFNSAGLGGDVTFQGNTAASLNLVFASIGAAGDPSVVVVDSTAKDGTIALNDARVALVDAGYETLSITGVGDNTLWLLGSESTAKSVTVGGPGSVDLVGGAPGPDVTLSAIETFDGSANGGGITANIVAPGDATVSGGSGGDTLNVTGADLSVSTGAGNDTLSVGGDKLTIVLGAGDDKLTVTTDPDVSGSAYDGGEGFDTLLAGQAQLALLGAALSAATPTVTFANFEAVGVTDSLTTTIDLTKFGVGSIELQAGANAGAVDGLANGASVVVLGTTTGLTLNQVDSDADALTITIGTDKSTGVSLTGVAADDTETLTVNSLGDGTGTNTLALSSSTDLASVTVSGKEGLVFASADGNLTTFDASAAEGDINASGAAYLAGKDKDNLVGITITGGAGDDYLTGGTTFNTNSIGGGGGDDVIVGGSLADTLRGDAGDDDIYAAAGDDTVLGGDGDDYVDASLGKDSVSGGAGNDILYGDAAGDPFAGSEDTIDGGDGNDELWGGAAKDTMTGGAGEDIFGYQAASQSQGVNTDTITDFVSGTDTLGFQGFLFGAIAFLGNVATSDEATSALDNADTAGTAVYNQATSQVLVDTTGSGVADMTITLTGVSTLAQDDFAVI
jgi:Ca2+-binding RTX toxin-like protein